ncbi:MAG TPA: lysophospholipid acyltransferase family protein [Bacteroidota bacterium]|nr:lysophospholipid acyltransferase family protein [Bacteroidota bacterium]
MRHRLEFIFFQLFKWFVLILPLKSTQRLGAYLGVIGYKIFSRRREIALDNLRTAFPGKSERECVAIARGAFKNYGITLTELLWFPNLNDVTIRKLVNIKNIDLVHSKYSLGKGLVLLSGHFGNWELIALAVAYISKLPVTIIVQTQSNRLVDGVINKHRCLFGNKAISMGISLREIIRTLDSGGIIAIAPDQSGPMEGVFVDFFGRSVATHQGPAAFALRKCAPMIMGFMIRKADWTYDVVFEEIPTSDLVSDTAENILELTRRHTLLLERYIREYPNHWLWMHRRWKHLENVVHSEDTVVNNSQS